MQCRLTSRGWGAAAAPQQPPLLPPPQAPHTGMWASHRGVPRQPRQCRTSFLASAICCRTCSSVGAFRIAASSACTHGRRKRQAPLACGPPYLGCPATASPVRMATAVACSTPHSVHDWPRFTHVGTLVPRMRRHAPCSTSLHSAASFCSCCCSSLHLALCASASCRWGAGQATTRGAHRAGRQARRSSQHKLRMFCPRRHTSFDRTSIPACKGMKILVLPNSCVPQTHADNTCGHNLT